MNLVSVFINKHRGYQQFSDTPSDSTTPSKSSTAKYNEAAALTACRSGDSQQLEIELSKDPDAVHRKFKSGKTGNRITLLWMAAQQGHHEICKTLLVMGANVNKSDDYGTTPLGIASEYGHCEVAEELLNNGADVNLPSIYSETPLLIASDSGHSKVVELLINSGADVDKPVNEGVTPLFAASQNGHKHVVELLLAAGADPQKKWRYFGPFTKSTLSAAKQEGNDEIVKLLKTAIRQRKAEHGVATGAGSLLSQFDKERYSTFESRRQDTDHDNAAPTRLY